jgi:hypothetical protein
MAFAVKTSKATKDKKTLAKRPSHTAANIMRSTPQMECCMAYGERPLPSLGSCRKDSTFLLEGLTEIEEAYNLDSIDERLSYSHGHALTSLAKYYDDVEYRYQAIEEAPRRALL